MTLLGQRSPRSSRSRSDSTRRRGTFVTLAAAFFTVAQPVVAATIGSADVSNGWIAAVIALAVLSAVVLAGTLKETFTAWRLLDEIDIKPERLRVYVEDAYAEDPLVPGRLAKSYAAILESRRKNNKERASRVDTAAEWCLRSMAITTVELVIALSARLLT